MKWLLILTLALPVLALLAGQIGLLRGTPPTDLGVKDGKLKRPSFTPNSVSSQADLWPDHPQRAYASVQPLSAHGDMAATMARLQAILKVMPGAQVVRSEDGYIYATFTTRLMKYTDDVEFWFDPAAGVVQVRSASRLGRKDFGANRQRIEAIRAALR
jgi:uncharacterized protein (DUF1499 family)